MDDIIRDLYLICYLPVWLSLSLSLYFYFYFYLSLCLSLSNWLACSFCASLLLANAYKCRHLRIGSPAWLLHTYIYLSICPSVRLSVYLVIYPHVRLSVRPSVSAAKHPSLARFIYSSCPGVLMAIVAVWLPLCNSRQ